MVAKTGELINIYPFTEQGGQNMTGARLHTDYAMKNAVLTHVSEVERGLKCGCVCPGCGENMIARKGTKRAHHFAHQSKDCSYGLETTLHLMAKTILEQEKKLLIPEVEIRLPSRTEVISPSMIIELDEVFLDKSLGERVPAVLAKSRGKSLMIEIRVTPEVDEAKKGKIENAGVSVIEIDLSKADKIITMESLRAALLEGTERTRWIYNSKSANYVKQLHSICDKYKVIDRGFYKQLVYSCPKSAREFNGKPYVNVHKDCISCEFYMAMKRHHDPTKEDEYNGYARLYCSCRANVASFSDLKEYIEKGIPQNKIPPYGSSITTR